MENKNKIRGKKNRASGKRFEDKVRKELEAAGFIVAKWNNNVDLILNKIVPGKPKWNPYSMGLMYTGVGFPDFIAIKKIELMPESQFVSYLDTAEIKTQYFTIGVECKSNGYVDKIEKQKLDWLYENKIFSIVSIAKKGKKRGSIEWLEWKKDAKA